MFAYFDIRIGKCLENVLILYYVGQGSGRGCSSSELCGSKKVVSLLSLAKCACAGLSFKEI